MTLAVGVDPASGKETCIWHNDDYTFVKPQAVRTALEAILEGSPDCLIAWDAPISFSVASYSDRLIDKITRRWVKSKVESGLLEKGAVNALPFSGLSHWVISCMSLGLPFGERIEGLSLYPEQACDHRSGANLLEVHPAVSMACMWLDREVEQLFPIYKKSKAQRKLIVETLDFPVVCIESDDILDAYVAYLMAGMFVENKAHSLCSPSAGSYVLPRGASFNELTSFLT